jgi:hypothetical protein
MDMEMDMRPPKRTKRISRAGENGFYVVKGRGTSVAAGLPLKFQHLKKGKEGSQNCGLLRKCEYAKPLL